MKLQLQRKAQVPQNTKRVFVDRDIPDGLAYATGTSYEKIKAATEKETYAQIFLIENIGSTEKNGVRRENHDEALKLGQKLEAVYRAQGYEPVRIKSAPLEQRVHLILEAIK